VPGLRAGREVSSTGAFAALDTIVRVPPGAVILEIAKFAPVSVLELAAPSFPDRYVAFVVQGGSQRPVRTLLDLGDAEELEELIAEAREEVTGEPDIEGGFVTISGNELQRLLRGAPGEPQSSYVTEVRSGQRRERKIELDADILRMILTRVENGEPLNHAERHRLGSGEGPLARPVDNDSTALGDLDPALRELGRRLLHPVVRRLRSAKQVVFAPDGYFWLLSPTCLPYQDGVPLVATCPVVVSDRAAIDTPAAPPNGKSAGPPLVVADPELSRSACGPSLLPPLPHAREEGLRVAALLGTTCHFGRAADDHLLRAVDSPLILHVAAHAFAVPDRRAGGVTERGRQAQPGLDLLAQQENPDLRTGLALAGAEDWFVHATDLPRPGDGVLLAADVAELDLRATELVVLSACHTGMGSVYAGDAPWSLARAFRRAGASAVVQTSWAVSDRATRLLMEAFYTGLLRGHPPAVALRMAQLGLRERGAAPRQWAAFSYWEPGPNA
jgi:hypothetical protein